MREVRVRAEVKASAIDATKVWTPPIGWIQTGEGVWTPREYAPNRWELEQPRVFTYTDVTREVGRCYASLPYFAFTYCWTVDEDDPGGINVRRIPAYGYLREFFAEMQTPENTHIEKSRQMIMSWSLMVVLLWDILFHEHWADLVVSKRAKDVDDGGAESTVASNFGKIRFIHQHLPEFLWQPFQFKKFLIRNPRLQSYINGETGKGSAASRGPTFKRGVMDEAAYVERSESVFKGLRQAAKEGTVLNSTPNGKANTFARIRFSTTTTFKKLSYHWTRHPRKSDGLYCVCGWRPTPEIGLTPIDQFNRHKPNCPLMLQERGRRPEARSKWYDEQARDMRPEDIASELDISYEKSRKGRVYYPFDHTIHVVPLLDTIGPRAVDESEDEYLRRYLKYALNPHLQTCVSWDFGVSDPTVMLLSQIVSEDPLRVRFIDELEDNEKSYDFYANYVRSVWRPVLKEIGAKDELHYGDPAAKQRDSKLESWASNLESEGIHLIREGYGEVMEWIDFIADLYKNMGIEISDRCQGLIDATGEYHYPLDADGNPLPGDHLPVHDEWSHKMDAKRYLFRNRYKDRLLDRKKKAAPTARILARGKGRIDRRTETRIF